MLEMLQLLQKLFLQKLELFAASAGAVFVKQLLLELLLVFLAKFLLLENYMLSPYIILVGNKLVG